MSRLRLHRVIAVLAAATLALTACGGGSDDSDAAAADEASSPGASGTPEPFTLRVGYIGTRDWGGPEGYANATGDLLEALAPVGVTAIETFAFPNGPDLNNALSGGALDIGLYGDTPAINFRAAGNETRVFNQNRIDLSATVYTPVGGVTSLEDLEGGTVGVAQGSYMHRFILGLLEEEGLANSVEVTNLPVADTVAALQSGSVDAAVLPWSSAPVYEAQGFPALVSTFPDYPELAGSSVTVGTQEFLDAHPGFVEAWNEARTASIALIAEDPEPYYAFQAPILDVDPGVVPELEDLDDFPTESFTDEGLELLEGTKQFLVDIGAAQSDFEITEWQLNPGGS